MRVEVDIPASLTGIQFAFAGGALTIQCRGFTGDIVLSKTAATAATGAARSRKQHTTTVSNSASKKRPIDLSASDDDDDDDAKRLRPNFLNDAEQTMLLAQLDTSQHSSEQSDQQEQAKAKKAKQKKAKTEKDTKAPEIYVPASATTEDEAEAASVPAKADKKTPAKKSKKKKTSNSSEKDNGDSFFSPASKQSTTRKSTPETHKKRGRTPKTRVEESPAKSTKDLVCGPGNSTQSAVEATGNVPPERWGHTATKISEERVVVYGGADDEERTLGDLHLFDLKTRRWTAPINCDTIPRTWHDTVYLDSKHLLLVFGGERYADDDGKFDILSDIMVLDTECFLWYPPAIRGTAPVARSGHTCTVIGNDVVVFGGSRGRNRQSSLYILDSDEWEWKTVKVEGKPPSARTYHSAVTVGDDRIIYFGGNDSTKSFNSVHVLQKKAGDAGWLWFHPCVVGTPPQARTGHSATLMKDGKVLIFGGWDPQPDDASAPTSVFDDAFLLDITTWEWESVLFPEGAEVEPAQRKRVGHRAVCDADGRVLLFGGQNGGDQRLKGINAISISQQQKQEPPLPEPEREAPSSGTATATVDSLEVESL
ncbi:hypothetical protein BBJ28_00007148 [Nothophytophthora sp. Chile5]|nr:hypothetical protein BBJ28_00007148 [Nothophytophthora sp. Chile5]